MKSAKHNCNLDSKFLNHCSKAKCRTPAYSRASQRTSINNRGVDEPEQSGAAFWHLVFSQNACPGTYYQISRNALYWVFRYLFVMGQKGHSVFLGGRNEKFSGNHQKRSFRNFSRSAPALQNLRLHHWTTTLHTGPMKCRASTHLLTAVSALWIDGIFTAGVAPAMGTTRSTVKQQQVCLEDTDNHLGQAPMIHFHDNQQMSQSKRLMPETQ